MSLRSLLRKRSLSSPNRPSANRACHTMTSISGRVVMDGTTNRDEKIKDSLLLQQSGNVRRATGRLNAILMWPSRLQVAWLPGRSATAHHHVRMNRWAKNGVLDRVFEKLQLERSAHQDRGLALDSTSVKVHPDGTGALKTDRRRSASRGADGTPRFIWLPRMLERP